MQAGADCVDEIDDAADERDAEDEVEDAQCEARPKESCWLLLLYSVQSYHYHTFNYFELAMYAGIAEDHGLGALGLC
jgi:hypothetical protein